MVFIGLSRGNGWPSRLYDSIARGRIYWCAEGSGSETIPGELLEATCFVTSRMVWKERHDELMIPNDGCGSTGSLEIGHEMEII